eukprot:NODE_28159_length_487_cov_1.900000.p1 GENE.NODE_28159_length_487_cov_1.900000~~NODE_28159_length_487_cov_1.900000.p1  ORF type:complete len:119 (+),score=40.52 NODE_28159_length_487_cov_1.900000:90-446(+)
MVVEQAQEPEADDKSEIEENAAMGPHQTCSDTDPESQPSKEQTQEVGRASGATPEEATDKEDQEGDEVREVVHDAEEQRSAQGASDSEATQAESADEGEVQWSAAEVEGRADSEQVLQ